MKKLLFLFLMLLVTTVVFSQPREYRAKRLICDSVKIGSEWISSGDVALMASNVGDTVTSLQTAINTLDDTVTYFQGIVNGLNDTVTALQDAIDILEASHNYLSYLVEITQTGTSVPTTTRIYHNDFDTVMVWTRSDSGVYNGTFDGDTLDADSVVVSIVRIYPPSTTNYAIAHVAIDNDDGSVNLYTWIDGHPDDVWTIVLEIRHYRAPVYVGE